jgi:hypothetical protein
MSEIRLDVGDAIELAELLTLLAEWAAGSQEQILANSLASYLGSPGYDLTALRNDLRRFVFLLGLSDGQQLFGEPTT